MTPTQLEVAAQENTAWRMATPLPENVQKFDMYYLDGMYLNCAELCNNWHATQIFNEIHSLITKEA